MSEESDLVVQGRIAQQAPEIDGVTYVGLSENMQAGDLVKAYITQATDYDLVAELIE